MTWYSTRDTVDIYFLHYLVGCPSLFDVPSPESETTHDNDWDLPGESYQFFEFLSILSVTRDTPRGVEKFPIRHRCFGNNLVSQDLVKCNRCCL